MQANTNSSTPQLATFMLPAMGCQIQISLHITQLSLQQTQGNTDQEIDQKIDQKVALVKAYPEQQLLQWGHIFGRLVQPSGLRRPTAQTTPCW